MDNTTIGMILYNIIGWGGFFYFWNRKAVNEWFSSGKAKDWAITWFVGGPIAIAFLAVVAFVLSILM